MSVNAKNISTCEIINKFFTDFMTGAKVNTRTISMWKNKEKEFQILINHLMNKPEKSEKKKRVKKSKDAPKNAKSAYIIFCQEMRVTVKEENPDLSSKEILTKLGAMWKDIKDTDEVEKYNQLATNDKDRYKDEMANYVPVEETEKIEKKAEAILDDDEGNNETKSNEDIVREIIENYKSDSITVKIIKNELKNKGFEIDKNELKKIIAKIRAEDE